MSSARMLPAAHRIATRLGPQSLSPFTVPMMRNGDAITTQASAVQTASHARKRMRPKRWRTEKPPKVKPNVAARLAKASTMTK